MGAGLSALLGDPVDPTRLLGSREFPGIGWLVIPLEIVFFGDGEEVGWRGYALDALQAPGLDANPAVRSPVTFFDVEGTFGPDRGAARMVA